MTRINSNIPSLIAQSNLNRANDDLEVRLQRLATGIRINRGADDPAGLIVSERLRTELAGVQQGVKNSERASRVIATTEGALSEVSELLNSIRALVVEAANTGAFSAEEREANQLQIDSAIESITRIANTASFAGLKLLDGSLAYELSSVASTDIAKASVNGVQFGNRSTVDVDVEVISSAQTAGLYFNTDFTPANDLPNELTVELAGRSGVSQITFGSGSTVQSIIDGVNSRSSVTGVSASLAGGNNTSGIVFNSIGYGSDEFVSVTPLSGGAGYTFARLLNDAPGPIDWAGGSGTQWTGATKDDGKDVVVLLNGAVATGRGLEVQVRGPELDVELLLTSAFATTVSGTPTSFNITGGGALFQLGPEISPNQQANVGVNSITATRLGGSFLQNEDGDLELQFLSSLKSGEPNSLRGNLQNASEILESSIDEISTLRGRLGAFERNVLDTNIRSLQTSVENVTASVSVIRDADFAQETAQLTRAQVLAQSGTSVLSLANQQAQSVLALLG